MCLLPGRGFAFITVIKISARTRRQNDRLKFRHAWTCLFTVGIGIHCSIRGVSTDWCTTLFRLATSVFVFLFQVFRMACKLWKLWKTVFRMAIWPYLTYLAHWTICLFLALWFYKHTISSTVITFFSVRVYFNLPVSCLWSVLHVSKISLNNNPTVTLLQFIFKNFAIIFGKLFFEPVQVLNHSFVSTAKWHITSLVYLQCIKLLFTTISSAFVFKHQKCT